MSIGKTNAMRLLDAAAVSYETHEYDTTDGALDAASVARKINRAPEQVFKTLVTESAAHEYFVFLIPAAEELDLKKAARAAGVKQISMLPLKQLFPLTGYRHGGCSPVGMKKLFPTYIEETAQLFDRICFSGGRIGLNLESAPEALASCIGACFAPLTRE